MPIFLRLRNTCFPSSISCILFLCLLYGFPLHAQNETSAKGYFAAQELLKQGNYREALSLNETLLKSENSSSEKDLLLLYNQRGFLLTVLAQIDSAQSYLNKAILIAKSDSARFAIELGDCYHNSALAKMEAPNIDGLEQRVLLAISTRKVHDPDKVIESELLMGRFFMKTGQIPVAEKHYEEISNKYPDRNGFVEGKLSYQLGVSKIFLRKPEEALNLFKNSMDSFQTYYEGKDHPEMIFTYTYLGFLYAGFGKLLSARKNSERALELQHKFFDADHQDFGILYYYAGGIYNNMAEFERAAIYFKEALLIDEIYTGKELNNRSANYYMSLGAAYKGMNDFDASVKANLKAINYYNSQEREHPFMDQLYANLGMTYTAMGETDKALEYLDLSYVLAAKKFPDMHPSMIIRFKAYADCYLKIGNAKKALEYYEKISQIEAEQSGGISSNLSKFLSDQGQIWRKEMKDKDKALDFQKQALAALNMEALLENPSMQMSNEARHSPKYLVAICSEIGKILSDYGTSEEDKLANQLKALDILVAGEILIDSTQNRFLTESNKLGLAKSSRFLYETAIDLSYQLFQRNREQKFLATAFRMTEKSKALLLLLGLKHVQALQSAGIPENILEKEQELEIELMETKNALSKLAESEGKMADSLQNSLFTLDGSRDSLIQHLEKNFPQYFKLKYEPNIPEIAEVQSDLLREDQAGLVYFLGKENLFSFYISPSAITFHKKELPEKFKDRVQQYRDLIYAPLSSQTDKDFQRKELDFIQESRFFHDFLLEPLSDKNHLSYQRLRVIPDGILSIMNFDLLMAKDPAENEEIKDYAFAIKSYGISTAYSTGLLQYLSETKLPERNKTTLIAFQPSYPAIEGQEELFAERRAGFGPLKFSAKEVEGISNWYSTEVYAGEKASEESFYAEARNFPIIHISSHAQVPESNPQAAFVALTETDNSKYDDSLMIEELYAQRLQAEMVVLSACETGTGKLVEGEGIMSLGRAFTYAGARSLVMSLWEVNDASTADIMTNFYKYLSEGKSKDLALREAKLEYLKSSDKLHAQPYYWAAFVASGDMQPLPNRKGLPWLWLLGILAIAALFFFVKKRKVHR